jgi:hypothetical protein
MLEAEAARLCQILLGRETASPVLNLAPPPANIGR